MKAINLMGWMMVGAFALTGAGCGPAQGTGEARQAVADLPAAYEPGLGLRLADVTREAMQLEYDTARQSVFIDRHVVAARCLGSAAAGAGRQLRAVVPPDRKPAPDAKLNVRVPGGAATNWSARLLGVDEGMRAVDGNIELLVTVNERADVEAGRGLELVYPVGEERDAPGVPTNAVVTAALGDFVYEDTGDHLARRRVRLGANSEGRVEIKSGLTDGARLVVRGACRLWILELALVGGMGNLEDAKEAR